MASDKQTQAYIEKLTTKNRLNWIKRVKAEIIVLKLGACLLYTSDAADE